MLQILRQEVNQGITYSYTIPATKSSPSVSEELKPKHIPLPSLPSEEDDITVEQEVTVPSDQATQVQQKNSFKPELRTQNQGLGDKNSNNQYSKSQDSRITNSDTIYYHRPSQHVGNAYTNSQFSASNPGYSYAVNPYGNQRRSQGLHRHRHHRNRHSRSHRHQVVVQSSPERRYDLQPNSGSLRTSNVPFNPNKPHIISALTPEGQRRYQFASQQSQSGVYPNRGAYPNQGQYIQPLVGQAGYNPNLGVQGPPVNGQQYGSYYQTTNRGRYTDPITLGRAPLNDQISLNLPDSRTQQIGNIDIVNDYSWRISGFTDCSHSCGGGR